MNNKLLLIYFFYFFIALVFARIVTIIIPIVQYPHKEQYLTETDDIGKIIIHPEY
jgi:hypothetical protein